MCPLPIWMSIMDCSAAFSKYYSCELHKQPFTYVHMLGECLYVVIRIFSTTRTFVHTTICSDTLLLFSNRFNDYSFGMHFIWLLLLLFFFFFFIFLIGQRPRRLSMSMLYKMLTFTLRSRMDTVVIASVMRAGVPMEYWK